MVPLRKATAPNVARDHPQIDLSTRLPAQNQLQQRDAVLFSLVPGTATGLRYPAPDHPLVPSHGSIFPLLKTVGLLLCLSITNRSDNKITAWYTSQNSALDCYPTISYLLYYEFYLPTFITASASTTFVFYVTHMLDCMLIEFTI